MFNCYHKTCREQGWDKMSAWLYYIMGFLDFRSSFKNVISYFFKHSSLLLHSADAQPVSNGRHDTQHNDTQHNDTQHNDTQHNGTWRSILLCWVSLYAECRLCWSFMLSFANKLIMLSVVPQSNDLILH